MGKNKSVRHSCVQYILWCETVFGSHRHRILSTTNLVIVKMYKDGFIHKRLLLFSGVSDG